VKAKPDAGGRRGVGGRWIVLSPWTWSLRTLYTWQRHAASISFSSFSFCESFFIFLSLTQTLVFLA
jgi:hypothetical protein